MASNGDGFLDDSVKGPAGQKTKNKKLQGPFAYEKKIKAPRDDPELSQHVFKLPVDSEHKAKAINLFSIANPHMRSFHLNWIAFFITFFSAYGAAPLIPTIRQDVGLSGYKANEAGMQNCTHIASDVHKRPCPNFHVAPVTMVQVLLQVWSPPRELLWFACSWVKRATSLGLDIVSIVFPTQPITVHAIHGCPRSC